MLKLILGVASAPPPTGPTALLKLVAGEFAPAVAAIWPEPHAAFLTAATARRHLVCLALGTGRDVAGVAERVLTGRLREAISVALGRRTPGLERALGRLGETAWTAADYRKLLELLANPKAGKLLRHAEAVDAEAIARLALLPAPMGLALNLALGITDDGAIAIAEAAGAIACRSGAAVADAAAARWAGAESEAALYEAVRGDLYGEPPPPPFPATARLMPLATKAAIRDAAKRFSNCLETCLSHAVSGWSAYYEWTEGDGAILCLTRDAIYGWRLEEAKGPGNALLDKAARAALLSDLGELGVFVGRNSWHLERALHPDVGRTWRLTPLAENIAEIFGD
jgi:hypothetical protein